MQRLPAIFAGLWAGSLLTVCAIVAPTLFAVLDDRGLAGELAGRFFSTQAWLGLGLAIAMFGSVYVGQRRFPRTDVLLIALTAAAPLASELLLGPAMEHARAGGDMARFGMLHGASAMLFLSASVGALALAWRLNRPTSFSRPAG